jgi:opacity protein-like surface antigen
MRLVRLFFGIAILLCALVPGHAQDYSKFLFNVGGGIGFPLGNLSNFVNDGGNFVIGGGYGFMKHIGVDTEFMWHDLPINDATKAHLQTPGASARQYSWTFNPIVHAQLGDRFGVYGIGGIGWYHRSGETTTPGVGVICDPYWSWWYGCTLGSVNIVTGSRSSNSFGENIGGGATIRLGGGHVNFYTEIRYHHAGYNRVSTNLLPLTFGIRLF